MELVRMRRGDIVDRRKYDCSGNSPSERGMEPVVCDSNSRRRHAD